MAASTISPITPSPSSLEVPTSQHHPQERQSDGDFVLCRLMLSPTNIGCRNGCGGDGRRGGDNSTGSAPRWTSSAANSAHCGEDGARKRDATPMPPRRRRVHFEVDNDDPERVRSTVHTYEKVAASERKLCWNTAGDIQRMKQELRREGVVPAKTLGRAKLVARSLSRAEASKEQEHRVFSLADLRTELTTVSVLASVSAA